MRMHARMHAHRPGVQVGGHGLREEERRLVGRLELRAVAPRHLLQLADRAALAPHVGVA